MAKASWRDGFTIERVYPEGLLGLIELVHCYVPKASWGDGPFGAFVALIERNLADWEAAHDSRGHLVGMGMGSIFDLGGPGRRAPKEEREQFDRFDEALRWLHGLTWICAEEWAAHGKRWNAHHDRDLLTTLEVRRQVVVPIKECLRCGWQAAARSEMTGAVNTLGKVPSLRQLVVRGGRSVARALLRPHTGTQLAGHEKIRDALAAALSDQGIKVSRRRCPARCPACQGRLVGSFLTLEEETVRALVRG